MGVSIYYTARRERPLSTDERHEVTKIATEETRELIAQLNQNLPNWQEEGIVPSYIGSAEEICEGLVLYDFDTSGEPEVILEGASKLSHGQCGNEPMIAQLEYYATFALGRLRQVLPDADWHVHVDDMPLHWANGQYSFT